MPDQRHFGLYKPSHTYVDQPAELLGAGLSWRSALPPIAAQKPLPQLFGIPIHSGLKNDQIS